MKKVLISIFIIILIFVLYGLYINPQGLTTKEYKIINEKIASSFNDFKIIHFSDLLLGSTQTINSLEKVVNKINDLNADIIVFTGDLISKDYKLSDKEKKELKKLLKSLECSLYKYTIIGDNDKNNIETYEEIMNESDFTILNNDYTYLFYKDINPIKIIGLTDTENIDKLYNNEEGINPTYTIVLTHYSDNIDTLIDTPTDLVLAGNSLGGQIRLPFVGSLIKKHGSNKYVDEYYEINDIKLYVSNGLGTEKYKFRTFNKPTINIYKLSNK